MTHEEKPEFNEKVLDHHESVDVPETISEEGETVRAEKEL